MATAIITGASRGIGREITEKLAKDGYNISFCYRKSDDLAQGLVNELLKDKVWVRAAKCDVGKEEEVKAFIEDTYKTFGSIDVIVNNAGIQLLKCVQDTSLDEWNEILSTCLTSAFLTTKYALPYMLNKGGSIINIGSMWGEVGGSVESAYSAAKGGLFAFTKALAKELAPEKIRVNALSLGVIDTDMTRSFDDNSIERLIENTPLMRLGTPKDVADAVSFLAGEGSSFITGEILRVNGGFVI